MVLVISSGCLGFNGLVLCPQDILSLHQAVRSEVADCQALTLAAVNVRPWLSRFLSRSLTWKQQSCPQMPQHTSQKCHYYCFLSWAVQGAIFFLFSFFRESGQYPGVSSRFCGLLCHPWLQFKEERSGNISFHAHNSYQLLLAQ